MFNLCPPISRWQIYRRSLNFVSLTLGFRTLLKKLKKNWNIWLQKNRHEHYSKLSLSFIVHKKLFYKILCCFITFHKRNSYFFPKSEHCAAKKQNIYKCSIFSHPKSFFIKKQLHKFCIVFSAFLFKAFIRSMWFLSLKLSHETRSSVDDKLSNSALFFLCSSKDDKSSSDSLWLRNKGPLFVKSPENWDSSV